MNANTIERLIQTLTVPAAEYVPAISDALLILEEARDTAPTHSQAGRDAVEAAARAMIDFEFSAELTSQAGGFNAALAEFVIRKRALRAALAGTPGAALVNMTAAEAGRDALDAAIQHIESWRDSFIEEHGHGDPGTGALEFGTGAHAERKQEFVGELEEAVQMLRRLAEQQ